MKRLMAIGGGINGGDYVPEIERIVISGLPQNPKIIYVDSGDSSAYEEFSNLYMSEFGFEVDLFSKETGIELLKADLIYLGRGSTIQLMKTIKENDAADLIRKAYESGYCAVAGFSAGANSLFTASMSSENGEMTKIEDGLGLIAGFVCTHYNYDDRKDAFLNEIGTLDGYGLDDYTMLIVDDEGYRAISVREGYKISQYKKGVLQ